MLLLVARWESSNMKKKITKMICGISLVGSLIGGAVLPIHVDVANRLNDTKVALQMDRDITIDSSTYEAIVWARSRDIISQNADGTFKPSALITEAEFAKMLSTFLNLKDVQGNVTVEDKPKTKRKGD